MRNMYVATALLLALSACATRPPEVAVAPPPAPAETPPPALPAGATPGMAIPTMLADGSFPTPNSALTPAATVWHLRAGLNVAALACRADEAVTVARYNALLAAHRVELAAAETTYSAEFRARGADWRDRYDDAMTRLYNFYATPPARAAFCTAAAQVLGDAATVPAGGLDAFAAARLPALTAAFTDFYRAYDAWRQAQQPRVVFASAAPAPLVAPQPAAASASASASPLPAAPMVAVVAPPRPRLMLDLGTLADDRVAAPR